MRGWVIIVLLAVQSAVWAQRADGPIALNSDAETYISAFGFGAMASDRVNTSFVSSLVNSDQLLRTEVDDQLGKLHAFNRIGGDYAIGFEGAWSPAGRPWSVLLNVRDQAHVSMQFSDDAFGLTFKGNVSLKTKKVAG